jgi:hypothetical protein
MTAAQFSPYARRSCARAEADGRRPFLGLPWTGIVGATAVQAVCDAMPGIVSHLDLGIVQPKGMVRR